MVYRSVVSSLELETENNGEDDGGPENSGPTRTSMREGVQTREGLTPLTPKNHTRLDKRNPVGSSVSRFSLILRREDSQRSPLLIYYLLLALHSTLLWNPVYRRLRRTQSPIYRVRNSVGSQPFSEPPIRGLLTLYYVIAGSLRRVGTN